MNAWNIGTMIGSAIGFIIGGTFRLLVNIVKGIIRLFTKE